MIISLNWIKEFVDLDGIEVDELVKRFGLSTAEIESVQRRGDDIKNVVVAEILSVENHPDSKKLHILKLNDGSGEPVQVVCGAPNVRVGMKVCFARLGANVRGLKISKAKLAGIESFGMCCGGDELGIESDTTGLVELDDNLEIGKDIKEIFPIDDVLIEIDNKSLTNRPDLWGHYGIAREFSAIFKKPLRPLIKEDLTLYNNLRPLDIKVSTDKCYRYSAMTVKNITTKKSPMTMKIRLNYCGMRDINLLTDITNYLMLEIGQPMHAFDNNIVKGINVIETDKTIPMTTLEKEEHLIEPNSVVICDENKVPVAIAGVKGGLKSGITDSTNSLLIESATFDAKAIRSTSRKIGLITDASLRYEKSLDPEMTVDVIARAIYLLKNIDKNIVVSSSLTDVYNYHYPKRKIILTADFLSRRGGVKITSQDAKDILTRLGFDVSIYSDEIVVNVPSFRATKDISIKEDLVEEIFRMYGYDNIKPEKITFPLEPVEQMHEHILEYKIKSLLASKYGMNELHSYIWNYADFNKEMGIDVFPVVHLMDSSNSGQSGIRQKLAPTLIKMFYENKNYFSNINIFEIARVADSKDEQNQVIEKKKLSVLVASSEKTEKELYLTLKKVVEEISCLLHQPAEYKMNEKTSSFYHPVNSCNVYILNKNIGEMGIIHPSVNQKLDKRFKIAVMELDINVISSIPAGETKIINMPKYQPVSLDFNFVADKNLPYGEIEKLLNEFRANYVMEHKLKDIYVNEEVLPNKKSYTINYTLIPKDRTMEASDIEKFSFRLIKHMADHNITLR